MAKKKQAKKKARTRTTKKKGRPSAKTSAPATKEKDPKADMAALKKSAREGQAALERARKEGEALREQAKSMEAAAEKAYREAVRPYREACRKAGVTCEFAGSRSPNVTPTVRFIVEKVTGGVKVMLRGKPETEEVIPFARLKRSIGKAAVAYVEKFIGDRAAVGNKQGTLNNRLRAVLAKK